MKTKATYYLHCYTVGLQYYQVLEVLKELETGNTLDLIPEPYNRYKNTLLSSLIMKKLGHFPRSQNRDVTKILQERRDAYKVRVQNLYS